MKYILYGVLVFWALVYFTTAFAQPHMPPTPVEIFPVQEQPLVHGVSSTGELRANHSVILKSEIAGKVVNLNLPEGQMVNGGTVIVELDDASAKAVMNQMLSKYENSKLNYDRLQTLAKKGMGSSSERDSALAALRFDEASLAVAKSQLDKTKIKAPFSGMLGLRKIDAGDYINPGEALVNLDDINVLLVDFRIPEKYLTALKAGQNVELWVTPYPDQTFIGKIYAISPQIDPITHTISARATLNNKAGMLRPGLFAKVKVVFERNEHAIIVPEQAVLTVNDKNYVYVIKDDTAKLVEIKTGVRENGQVEISKGLSNGDVIAQSGHMRLFDGAKVVCYS